MDGKGEVIMNRRSW